MGMSKVSKQKADQVGIILKKASTQEEEGETDVETPVSSPERDTSPSPSISNIEGNQGNITDEKSIPSSYVNETLPTPKEQKAKKQYVNWPLCDVRDPHSNDVLYGRGGGTNHHPGNKRYRKLVEGRKVDYVNSKRLDKPLVAFQ